jgi:UDP-N-acetylmuramoylalanine--D-glutamate ligase
MKNTDWADRQVIVVGAARQGCALAEYLAQRGAQVVMTDLKTEEELMDTVERFSEAGIRWVLGAHPLNLLDDADLIAVSGGVPLTIPLITEAIKREIPLTNDSQVFLEAVPCRVIGITGSAGKTTTTTLVGRMVREELGGERTWVGGNIGNPLLTDVDEMSPEDLAVVELSSFQLELMSRVPEIAGVLNITPNHLDRHGTMEAYQAAKAQIILLQGPADTAVLNRDDPGSWGLQDQVVGKLVSFGKDRSRKGYTDVYLDQDSIKVQTDAGIETLFPREIIEIRGEHNLENVLAAAALAWAAGISPRSIAAGVEGFTGVDHRLEFVRTWKGADWYNDSIATAPERALASMKSFSEPLVVLAGGRDKDLPWKEFAEYVREHVRHLILFGEAVPIIDRALRDAGLDDANGIQISRVQGLSGAVQKAAEVARPGDVVLLSPGGTSFDEFRDFAARGEAYKELVENLS